jgi:hypothetical protein
MSTPKTTTDELDRTDAPHPWRIETHGSERWGYLSIVDATGNRVCDLFPYAAVGGRGKEATMAIARQIVERANAE